MPETGRPLDPYRSFNWRIVIGETPQAYFTACTDIGVSIDVINYREAGNRQVIRAIPGQVRYSPITMYYGLTASRDIFNWMMLGVEGRIERRNVSIVMVNSDGNDAPDAPKWNLDQAWVAAWHGAKLDALSPEIAIESITLVYERLSRG